MAGETVRYQVAGEDFDGYYHSPVDGAPLVFIAHAWGGVTEYEMKRADMLVEQGYAAFAVDLFGAGVRPVEMEERKAMTLSLYQNRQALRDRLYGGLEVAKNLGAQVQNAVAMGYCFGGAAVLEFARSGVDLKGFVTFHGGLATPEGQDYSQAQGQYLILHGSADVAISLDDFASLAKQLEAAGLGHEMITYSGAPHAFTTFGSPMYREDADRKSWHRFLEFLQDTLR